MDGFDDLLPSRSALEENPFEDPFAKPRSGSPDPWNSWANQHQSTPDVQNPYPDHTSFVNEDDGSASATEAVFAAGNGSLDTLEPSSSPSTDPLDSAAQTTEDDDEPLRRSHGASVPQTPGFRESPSSTFDEIATIRPTVSEELEPSTPFKSYFPASPVTETPSSPPSTPSLHTTGNPTFSPKRTLSSSSSSKSPVERTVVSPLESPSSSGFDRSFASLALGGESIGGWKGAQSSWANDQLTSSAIDAHTDDDDDDKPIRQSSNPLPSVSVTYIHY
jgi:sorting nexin-1/2